MSEINSSNLLSTQDRELRKAQRKAEKKEEKRIKKEERKKSPVLQRETRSYFTVGVGASSFYSDFFEDEEDKERKQMHWQNDVNNANNSRGMDASINNVSVVGGARPRFGTSSQQGSSPIASRQSSKSLTVPADSKKIDRGGDSLIIDFQIPEDQIDKIDGRIKKYFSQLATDAEQDYSSSLMGSPGSVPGLHHGGETQLDDLSRSGGKAFMKGEYEYGPDGPHGPAGSDSEDKPQPLRPTEIPSPHSQEKLQSFARLHNRYEIALQKRQQLLGNLVGNVLNQGSAAVTEGLARELKRTGSPPGQLPEHLLNSAAAHTAAGTVLLGQLGADLNLSPIAVAKNLSDLTRQNSSLPFPYGGVANVLTPRARPILGAETGADEEGAVPGGGKQVSSLKFGNGNSIGIRRKKKEQFDDDEDISDFELSSEDESGNRSLFNKNKSKNKKDDKYQDARMPPALSLFQKDGLDLRLQNMSTLANRLDVTAKELTSEFDYAASLRELNAGFQQGIVTKSMLEDGLIQLKVLREQNRLKQEMLWEVQNEKENQFWLKRENRNKRYLLEKKRNEIRSAVRENRTSELPALKLQLEQLEQGFALEQAFEKDGKETNLRPGEVPTQDFAAKKTLYEPASDPLGPLDVAAANSMSAVLLQNAPDSQAFKDLLVLNEFSGLYQPSKFEMSREPFPMTKAEERFFLSETDVNNIGQQGRGEFCADMATEFGHPSRSSAMGSAESALSSARGSASSPGAKTAAEDSAMFNFLQGDAQFVMPQNTNKKGMTAEGPIKIRYPEDKKSIAAQTAGVSSGRATQQRESAMGRRREMQELNRKNRQREFKERGASVGGIGGPGGVGNEQTLNDINNRASDLLDDFLGVGGNAEKLQVDDSDADWSSGNGNANNYSGNKSSGKSAVENSKFDEFDGSKPQFQPREYMHVHPGVHDDEGNLIALCDLDDEEDGERSHFHRAGGGSVGSGFKTRGGGSKGIAQVSRVLPRTKFTETLPPSRLYHRELKERFDHEHPDIAQQPALPPFFMPLIEVGPDDIANANHHNAANANFLRQTRNLTPNYAFGGGEGGVEWKMSGNSSGGEHSSRGRGRRGNQRLQEEIGFHTESGFTYVNDVYRNAKQTQLHGLDVDYDGANVHLPTSVLQKQWARKHGDRYNMLNRREHAQIEREVEEELRREEREEEEKMRRDSMSGEMPFECDQIREGLENIVRMRRRKYEEYIGEMREEMERERIEGEMIQREEESNLDDGSSRDGESNISDSGYMEENRVWAADDIQSGSQSESQTGRDTQSEPSSSRSSRTDSDKASTAQSDNTPRDGSHNLGGDVSDDSGVYTDDSMTRTFHDVGQVHEIADEMGLNTSVLVQHSLYFPDSGLKLVDFTEGGEQRRRSKQAQSHYRNSAGEGDASGRNVPGYSSEGFLKYFGEHQEVDSDQLLNKAIADFRRNKRNPNVQSRAHTIMNLLEGLYTPDFDIHNFNDIRERNLHDQYKDVCQIHRLGKLGAMGYEQTVLSFLVSVAASGAVVGAGGFMKEREKWDKWYGKRDGGEFGKEWPGDPKRDPARAMPNSKGSGKGDTGKGDAKGVAKGAGKDAKGAGKGDGKGDLTIDVDGSSSGSTPSGRPATGPASESLRNDANSKYGFQTIRKTYLSYVNLILDIKRVHPNSLQISYWSVEALGTIFLCLERAYARYVREQKRLRKEARKGNRDAQRQLMREAGSESAEHNNSALRRGILAGIFDLIALVQEIDPNDDDLQKEPKPENAGNANGMDGLGADGTTGGLFSTPLSSMLDNDLFPSADPNLASHRQNNPNARPSLERLSSYIATRLVCLISEVIDPELLKSMKLVDTVGDRFLTMNSPFSSTSAYYPDGGAFGRHRHPSHGRHGASPSSAGASPMSTSSTLTAYTDTFDEPIIQHSASTAILSFVLGVFREKQAHQTLLATFLERALHVVSVCADYDMSHQSPPSSLNSAAGDGEGFIKQTADGDQQSTVFHIKGIDQLTLIVEAITTFRSDSSLLVRALLCLGTFVQRVQQSFCENFDFVNLVQHYVNSQGFVEPVSSLITELERAKLRQNSYLMNISFVNEKGLITNVGKIIQKMRNSLGLVSGSGAAHVKDHTKIQHDDQAEQEADDFLGISGGGHDPNDPHSDPLNFTFGGDNDLNGDLEKAHAAEHYKVLKNHQTSLNEEFTVKAEHRRKFLERQRQEAGFFTRLYHMVFGGTSDSVNWRFEANIGTGHGTRIASRGKEVMSDPPFSEAVLLMDADNSLKRLGGFGGGLAMMLLELENAGVTVAEILVKSCSIREDVLTKISEACDLHPGNRKVQGAAVTILTRLGLCDITASCCGDVKRRILGRKFENKVEDASGEDLSPDNIELANEIDGQAAFEGKTLAQSTLTPTQIKLINSQIRNFTPAHWRTIQRILMDARTNFPTSHSIAFCNALVRLYGREQVSAKTSSCVEECAEILYMRKNPDFERMFKSKDFNRTRSNDYPFSDVIEMQLAGTSGSSGAPPTQSSERVFLKNAPSVASFEALGTMFATSPFTSQLHFALNTRDCGTVRILIRLMAREFCDIETDKTILTVYGKPDVVSVSVSGPKVVDNLSISFGKACLQICTAILVREDMFFAKTDTVVLVYSLMIISQVLRKSKVLRQEALQCDTAVGHWLSPAESAAALVGTKGGRLGLQASFCSALMRLLHGAHSAILYGEIEGGSQEDSYAARMNATQTPTPGSGMKLGHAAKLASAGAKSDGPADHASSASVFPTPLSSHTNQLLASLEFSSLGKLTQTADHLDSLAAAATRHGKTGSHGSGADLGKSVVSGASVGARNGGNRYFQGRQYEVAMGNEAFLAGRNSDFAPSTNRTGSTTGETIRTLDAGRNAVAIFHALFTNQNHRANSMLRKRVEETSGGVGNPDLLTFGGDADTAPPSMLTESVSAQTLDVFRNVLFLELSCLSFVCHENRAAKLYFTLKNEFGITIAHSLLLFLRWTVARDDVKLCVVVLGALANSCSEEMLLDYDFLLRREKKKAAAKDAEESKAPGEEGQKGEGKGAGKGEQKKPKPGNRLSLHGLRSSQAGFLEGENVILLQHTIESMMKRHAQDANLMLVGGRVLGMFCSRR